MKKFWNKKSLDKLIDSYNEQIKKLEYDIILKALINNDWHTDSYYKTIKDIREKRKKLLSRYIEYATN